MYTSHKIVYTSYLRKPFSPNFLTFSDMQLQEDPLWGALLAQVNHRVPKHLPRYVGGPLTTLNLNHTLKSLPFSPFKVLY
jgi:hypothetical protein